MQPATATEPTDQGDYTESDDEGADGYRKGGYHVVTIGEVYNGRYTVVAKLGWGHFSTVWLCQDMRHPRFVAMKVQKSAPHYTEAAYDEIELLAQAAKCGGAREWEETQRGPLSDIFPEGRFFTGVVQLVDYFEHAGPHGKHVCMVFETMGPNVLALIKKYNFKGVPLDTVRKVSAHVLIGLDYLHRICGIIHTDLKPENVLVACPKGVPVNKQGIPLVGHIDPALLAAKRSAASDRLFQMREGAKQPKGEKKKGRKGKIVPEGQTWEAGEWGGKAGGERTQIPGPEFGLRNTNAAVLTSPAKSGPEVVPAPAAPPLFDEAAGVPAVPGAGAESKEGGEDARLAPTPALVPEKREIVAPPYMKPLLKPSRSDPTLLSSYGDDVSMLMRPPYHHFQAMHAASAMDPTGVAGGLVPGRHPQPPGAAPPASAAPQAKPGVSGPIDPKLLEEVVALDIFDHDTVAFKVADLGNACWVERHFSDDIQTRQYRSPETIINAGYDTSADMWSLACMIFELVTGDYLFDPKASEEYPRDEDHLALFTELLGPIPKSLVMKGRRSTTYFNRRGELRHIKSLRFWGLQGVLEQKYHMHPLEAQNLASFLGPMLRLAPEERGKAHELLAHPWLRGLPSNETAELASRVGGLGLPTLTPPAAAGGARAEEEEEAAPALTR
mmetsp:Transcript_55499/g.119795  ORF Transcript_55499/g.119795 Transcript_55499/m.119795 type:complete len:668 (-) Transcript_55499:126-2129(-)